MYNFSKRNDGYTVETEDKVACVRKLPADPCRVGLAAREIRDYHFKFLFYSQVMDKPSHCWYINLSVSDSSSGDIWA